jgi:uncharacterized membrane protein
MSRKSNPVTKQNNTIAVRQEISASFSGPLPHPDLLKKYNEIIPGLAEAIVDMAQKQQAHRFKIEEQEVRQKDDIIELNKRDSDQCDKALNIDSRNSLLGLVFAFLTVALIMSTSAICAYFNHPVSSAIIGAGGVCSIVYIFIYGTRTQRNNNKDS